MSQAEVQGEAAAVAADPIDGFVIEIASTGLRLHVPENDSIVDVLEDAGIHVDTSCTSGLCGTCKLGYLAGEVDHRDCILSDEERENSLTVCVSRAKCGVLVLDL